jgi:hypothetical protein
LSDSKTEAPCNTTKAPQTPLAGSNIETFAQQCLNDTNENTNNDSFDQQELNILKITLLRPKNNSHIICWVLNFFM